MSRPDSIERPAEDLLRQRRLADRTRGGRPAHGPDDRGIVAVWVVVVGLALVAFVSIIVHDGGTVLRTRSRAFTVAGAAARAGAQALDDAAAVGGVVRVDPAVARAAADQYLGRHEVDGSVTVDGDEVTVTVRDIAHLDFWPSNIAVSATATAAALTPPGEANP